MTKGSKEMNEIKGKKESRAEKKRRKKEAFKAKPWYKKLLIRVTQVFLYSQLMIWGVVILAFLINPASEKKKKAQTEDRLERIAEEQARFEEEEKKKEEAIQAEEARREALTPAEREAEDRAVLYQKIKREFFRFGPSGRINQAIKDQLNNPKSFEHVSTDFIVTPDPFIIVTTTFRATNSFNALILSEAVSLMNIHGVILSVEIQ